MNSLIDDILARYDMRLELNPYRIVNKYGIIIQKKHLDLREKTLKKQYNAGIKKEKFKVISQHLGNN